MRITRKLRAGLALKHGLVAFFAAAIAVLLLLLAREYRAQVDLTQSLKNSLSPGSYALLRELEGPIAITAFAAPEDAQMGDIRKLIADFFAPYRQAKDDITLSFVDPKAEPKRTRDAGVSANGEMVVEYAGKSERLTNLSEQSVANLLARLARREERRVMYVTGHGEASLEGAANHDLGEFGKELAAKGFELSGLNLAIAPEVPANISLLVITHPQVPLLDGEVAKLTRYVESGGNLLWLLAPEALRGLEALAANLQITLPPGTVIDPAATQLNLPPTWALAGDYAEHPIFRNFTLITVFPLARKIGTMEEKNQAWQTLIEVAQNGWIENGAIEKEVSFDAKQDTRGPVPIAVSLTRQQSEKNQRIVVVGSEAFLANAYVGNAGNRDLGFNLVNWLVGDEGLITIQPKNRLDSKLELDQSALLAITILFLVALPLIFFASAGWIWWKRRKA